jgi:predicted MFS family arabinose efflux permease
MTLRARLSVTVVLVLVAAMVFLSARTAERAERLLTPELERKAAMVGGATAALIDRALDVGIPFEQLQGLDGYLDRTLAANPDLASITIRDTSGKVLYGAERIAVAPAVRLPIGEKSGRTEILAVGLDPTYAREIVSGLWIDLLIVMFVTALIALELVYVGFGATVYGAIEGVERRLRTIRRGDLRLHTPVEGETEFGRFARSLDARLDALHEHYAALRRHIGERGDNMANQALDLLKARFRLGETLGAPPAAVTAVRAPLFVFMFAEELTRPFLPVYIRDLAAPIDGWSRDFVASLPMVVFLAVVALTQPFLGSTTDRIGRRRCLILGAVLGLVGYVASAAVSDLVGLTLARAVSGLGFALVFVSAQGFVIDSTDIRQRSSGMAMFIGAILVAGLCGPPIGGILADRLGIPATFIIAGLFAAASLGLALLCMPKDGARKLHGPAVRWRDFRPILSSPALASLFLLCAMPAKIILVAFCFFLVPLEMQVLGATQSATGRMLMIYPIMMVILVPVFARVSDRWERRSAFVALGGLIAGASAFFVLLGDGQQILPIALVLLGLGLGQAVSIAPLSGLVGELGRELGGVNENSVYGIFRLVERTGNALGPLIAGALLGIYGFRTTVMLIGGATAVSAALFGTLLALARERSAGVPAIGGG